MRIFSNTRWAIAYGTFALGALTLGACSDPKNELLAPQQPQIIGAGDIKSAAAADAFYVGALGRFKNSMNGGNNNQEELWSFEGLMSDEFRSSDTFSQRNDADERRTQTNDGVMTSMYQTVQSTRGFARTAINALNTYEPTATYKIAEMYFAMGFTEMGLAEDFCNGIPLGETDPATGKPIYTAPLTDSAAFLVAKSRFDSALTLLGTASDANSVAVRNAVNLAEGRVLMDLNQPAAAAAAVASVPASYQYLFDYSNTTQDNEWWILQASVKRYSMGDSIESGNFVANVVPYASLNDPRAPVAVAKGNGFDKQTPYFQVGLWNRDDQIAAVAWIDGQMILAENQLRQGNISNMMSILNAVRAAPPKLGIFQPAAMAALPTPASQAAAVQLFFREKALWTYGRGQRLGDLRRMVKYYGLTTAQVYKSGNYFKGGQYGPNFAFPVPDFERANPLFTGCLDTAP